MKFGAWYRNVISWWPHIGDKNVLWLKYEDMKNDLESTLDQILLFLGWQLQQSNRATVLQLCSFEWMKINSLKFSQHDENGVSYFIKDSFIRKGVVGEHKTLLSSSQENQILDRARNELPQECVNFLGLPN